MSQTVILELSDAFYETLKRQAETAGTSPADLVIVALERQFHAEGLSPSAAENQAARERFERHFGEVDLGYPTGADNESIDADLAREYADTHEEG